MDVAVIGAGRVGTALAVLLQRAGHRIVGVSGRTATQERVAEHLPGVTVEPAASVAHAAAVFASNFVVAVLSVADDVLRQAGVEDPIRLVTPLTLATVDAVRHLGPAAALTGPAARGDAGTIDANLTALGAHAATAVDP